MFSRFDIEEAGGYFFRVDDKPRQVWFSWREKDYGPFKSRVDADDYFTAVNLAAGSSD